MARGRSRRLVAIAIAAATATAAPARGGPAGDAAREHVRRGVALYERGELDAAIAELETAQRLEVTAEGCYALGQARRKQGDCRAAIASYRCAVERAPTEEFARAANYQIGRCVIERGIEPPSEPTPAPAPTLEARPPAPPWYRDVWGGVLCGVGLGATGVGIGLLLHAEGRAQAAGDDLAGFRDADGVRGERIAGGTTLAIGSALLVAGVVRYVVVGRR
jgi:tetratricopeptide (TPR) repeat protein